MSKEKKAPFIKKKNKEHPFRYKENKVGITQHLKYIEEDEVDSMKNREIRAIDERHVIERKRLNKINNFFTHLQWAATEKGE